jgi:Flp pilus assembly protein CpaB
MSAQQLKAKQKAASADQAFSDKMGVSLALNPNEAQYLALSQQQGQVSIVVRGLGDVELHPMEIASFKRLVK